MPVRLFAHASWTTFARLPLIDAGIAVFLRRFFVIEAARHRARTIEIGIVRNHVHVVVELPPTFDVPRLMQGLKGASARIANRDRIAAHETLRWAQGYDFRSIGVKQLESVTAYVRDQSMHHPTSAITGSVLQDATQAEPPLQGTDRQGVVTSVFPAG